MFLTIGDILKSEADWHSREAIPATTGTKIGQLVEHPLRKEPLVALSDEINGKVLVQPHNCVIFLDNIDTASLGAYVGSNGEHVILETLIAQGDKHGIQYVAGKAQPR